MVPGDPPVVPVRVERSVARVLPAGGGQPVGLAFALDRRHVVTCAHVVNEALGREDIYDITPPGDKDELLLQVRAGADGPERRLVRYAGVVVWLPAEGRSWFAVRDVAVLEVTEELPETVVRPPLLPGQSNGTVRMVGPQSTRHHEANVDGDLKGEVEADLLQVDEHLSNAFRMEPGSSGGPVWRPDGGEVVGMLVAGGRGRGPRDVYAVAADVLIRARAKPGLPLPRPRPPEPAPDQPPIRPVTRRRAAGAERPPRRAPSTARAAVATTALGDRLRPELGPKAQRWFRHPWLLAVSGLCGLLALAISAVRVDLGWALLYGARAAVVVHLAGVAAGIVGDLVALAIGERRSEGDEVISPATAQAESAEARRGPAA